MCFGILSLYFDQDGPKLAGSMLIIPVLILALVRSAIHWSRVSLQWTKLRNQEIGYPPRGLHVDPVMSC